MGKNNRNPDLVCEKAKSHDIKGQLMWSTSSLDCITRNDTKYKDQANLPTKQGEQQ